MDLCRYVSRSMALCRHLSRSIALCRYVSRSVALCRHLSRSIALCRYVSRSVALFRQLSRSIALCRYQSRSMALRRYVSRSMAVQTRAFRLPVHPLHIYNSTQIRALTMYRHTSIPSDIQTQYTLWTAWPQRLGLSSTNDIRSIKILSVLGHVTKIPHVRVCGPQYRLIDNSGELYSEWYLKYGYYSSSTVQIESNNLSFCTSLQLHALG
jgi:hypothetical protein